ncbi:glycosyltransferase family 4 protein [Calidifontibacter sp. DB0510]|uniref:D-inositol 3-phosphate glycosyltransferase n=1 Tax=Metallococcus carri TaxID=1656884 RepID=A0A967AYW2_9MICO|nr:glycosyltransferase family 4 protein [Metallococcus carri]NOP37298.1 glycosyltransferase family 4 protein [Calidifontibacter sp. DB2511S]
MRILYLSWRDREHPEAGGSETFVERTAEVMTSFGDAVTLFTARFKGADRQARHGDVTVLRRGNRFTTYLAGLLHLATHRGDYDVVIDVQNGVPFWTPLVAGRVPVVNVVHHVHKDQWAVIFGERIARFGWFLESKVAPRVYRGSRYVTVSQATREDLIGLGVRAKDIDLVYSGNDLPQDYLSYGDVPRTDVPSLVVLCRLVPHKQVEIAIDVVAQLREEFPDLRLDVVGSGYWQEELVRHAQRRAVSDAVTFHGFVDEPTKHRLLAQSWLSLMPSHKEGWGLTIVEAGLHATPTIAFAHAGGPSESIQHGRTGLLAHDRHDMAEQVRVLLRHHSLREELGAGARRHALSFDWAATGARLHEVVRNVAGRGPRPVSPAALSSHRRRVHDLLAEHLARRAAARADEPQDIAV